MPRKRVFLESITEGWSKEIGSEIHFPNGGKNMASNDAQRLNNPRPFYKNRSLLLSILYRRWRGCIVVLDQFFREIIFLFFFFLLSNLLNMIGNKEYKKWLEEVNNGTMEKIIIWKINCINYMYTINHLLRMYIFFFL